MPSTPSSASTHTPNATVLHRWPFGGDPSEGLKASQPHFLSSFRCPHPVSSKGGVTTSPTHRHMLTRLSHVCPHTLLSYTHTPFHPHAHTHSHILTHKCTRSLTLSLTFTPSHCHILICTHARSLTLTHSPSHTLTHKCTLMLIHSLPHSPQTHTVTQTREHTCGNTLTLVLTLPASPPPTQGPFTY